MCIYIYTRIYFLVPIGSHPAENKLWGIKIESFETALWSECMAGRCGATRSKNSTKGLEKSRASLCFALYCTAFYTVIAWLAEEIRLLTLSSFELRFPLNTKPVGFLIPKTTHVISLWIQTLSVQAPSSANKKKGEYPALLITIIIFNILLVSQKKVVNANISITCLTPHDLPLDIYHHCAKSRA